MDTAKLRVSGVSTRKQITIALVLAYAPTVALLVLVLLAFMLGRSSIAAGGTLDAVVPAAALAWVVATPILGGVALRMSAHDDWAIGKRLARGVLSLWAMIIVAGALLHL